VTKKQAQFRLDVDLSGWWETRKRGTRRRKSMAVFEMYKLWKEAMKHENKQKSV